MADYKGVLADFRTRRLALQREQEALDTAISALEALARTDRPYQPGTQAQAPGVTARAFNGLTMPKAIEKYLMLAQQPQTKKQIQDALRAGGVRATAKSFSAHVYNTLHRLSKESGPFRRESDGRWALSQWSAQSGNTGLLENAH